MHWKALFDYKHLGCQDLPRDPNDSKKVLDLVVSIKSLAKREVIGDGGRKDLLPVAELNGHPKPLILNKTNLGKLADLFGSSDYEDFIGKPFTLYAARVEGKGKKIVDGLRIRDTRPVVQGKTKEDLTPIHPKWNGAKQALKDGNTTVEAIRGTYNLSPENETLITKQ
jgi:hypothetical protein